MISRRWSTENVKRAPDPVFRVPVADRPQPVTSPWVRRALDKKLPASDRTGRSLLWVDVTEFAGAD